MTTAVTITTHDRPARVGTFDRYKTDEVDTEHVEYRTIPPNTTEQLHITDTRSLSFSEMPIAASSVGEVAGKPMDDIG